MGAKDTECAPRDAPEQDRKLIRIRTEDFTEPGPKDRPILSPFMFVQPDLKINTFLNSPAVPSNEPAPCNDKEFDNPRHTVPAERCTHG
jgi:hypothetical protein